MLSDDSLVAFVQCVDACRCVTICASMRVDESRTGVDACRCVCIFLGVASMRVGACRLVLMHVDALCVVCVDVYLCVIDACRYVSMHVDACR